MTVYGLGHRQSPSSESPIRSMRLVSPHVHPGRSWQVKGRSKGPCLHNTNRTGGAVATHQRPQEIEHAVILMLAHEYNMPSFQSRTFSRTQSPLDLSRKRYQSHVIRHLQIKRMPPTLSMCYSALLYKSTNLPPSTLNFNKAVKS